LHKGLSRREVASELGIKFDTLRKAINQGRVNESVDLGVDGATVEQALSLETVSGTETPDGASPHPDACSTKSQRGQEDAAAEMGTACTRPVDRTLAAFGILQGAGSHFQPCQDVSFGGVMCALPALAHNGLFRHLNACLGELRGYYTTAHVMLLLAYMALCRIRTVERLQYESPGELGKLLGLDRIPEVRCLRKKLALLSTKDAVEKWAGLLSRDWMQEAPEWAGTLYVDGHVRLYHGNQTKLPRRYVARQRLCLRATTDYWVNDAVGRPFFVVGRTIDHGMLEVLRNDVVPRLLQDVPGQPSEAELEADPLRSRFVLIFDREAYSPIFFREMWQCHRIACITYHKFPKEQWPTEWFVPTSLDLPSGERVSVLLAERGSFIGSRKNGLWVREVRKLTASGHQTSLISSAYDQQAPMNAAALFSRWSQENFFRYMMQHFAIDLLSEYDTEEIPGTHRPVINPSWRDLERQRRSLKSKLTQCQARFAALTLHPQTDTKKLEKWQQQKADSVDEIQHLENALEGIKESLKQAPKHLEWDELPPEHQFQRLAPSRKRLVDAVKMIAYRAETALMYIVRESLARPDDARALLQDLFRSEADLLPDPDQGLLHVRVHPMANPRSNRAITHLLNHLNEAEFTFPGTRLKLTYTLGDVAQG